jgi:hypothetical protein
MLEQSLNLQKIIFRGDEHCDECDEEEMVAERIRDGIFSPEITFDEDWWMRI